MDSGHRASLLDNGPEQPMAGDVEMAMRYSHGEPDLVAELAAVASVPPRPSKLKRSNSIVF